MEMFPKLFNRISPKDCQEVTSEGGHHYLSPPIHGLPHDEETRVKALVMLSRDTGMVVGWLEPGGRKDAAYYVVTPFTTAKMVTEQLKRSDGSDGFEKALEAAKKELEAYKLVPVAERPTAIRTFDGLRYREPPVTDLDIWNEQWISALKFVSERDRCVFAKMNSDGSYFVITPTTTSESMREQLKRRGGVEAFETAIELAYREQNENGLQFTSFTRTVPTGKLVLIPGVTTAEQRRKAEQGMIDKFTEQATAALKERGIVASTNLEDLKDDLQCLRVEIISDLGAAKKIMGVLYLQLDLPVDSHPSEDQFSKINSLYESVEQIFKAATNGYDRLDIDRITTDKSNEELERSFQSSQAHRPAGPEGWQAFLRS